MKKKEYTEDALIADMKATFPGLMARHGIEFSSKYPGTVWTGGEGDMPDGLPIFAHWSDAEEYDGGVHRGFTAWLENRGWYLENYDGVTFLAYPSCAMHGYEEMKARWADEHPNASPEEYTAAMQAITRQLGI